MTYLIIDLILFSVIAFSAWRGFRTGIINGICGVLAVVIAIYGANLVSSVYAEEFIPVVEPFAGGMVDDVVTNVIGYETDGSAAELEQYSSDEEKPVNENPDEKIDDLFIPVVELSEDDKTDVNAVTFAVLREFGVSDDAAYDAAAVIAGDVESVSREMNDAIVAYLCQKLMFIVLFTIAFTLFTIIFMVVGNVFDVAFGLPGLENVNHIIGGLLGVLRGVMLILVIGFIVGNIGMLLPEKFVESTALLEKVTVDNPLYDILN